jgi:DNA-binding MarR family transcriptional regulator
MPVKVDPPDVLDRLARDMVSSLDRILDLMVTAAPAVEGAGLEIPLTLQEMRLLKTIAQKDPTSMSTLAASMRISLPTATHLVDRLVAKGVVVRTRSEQDRRLVLVALSERSKAHAETYFKNRITLAVSILEPLEPAEREQAVKALSKIARLAQSRFAGQADHTDPQ